MVRLDGRYSKLVYSRKYGDRDACLDLTASPRMTCTVPQIDVREMITTCSIELVVQQRAFVVVSYVRFPVWDNGLVANVSTLVVA